MDSEVEWIAVDEAARQLANRFGGISRAREAIALSLFEQMLSARASSVVHLDGMTVRVDTQRAKPGEGIAITREVWSSCYNFNEQKKGWDWETGAFVVEALPPGDLYNFGGVELLKAEVDALAPGAPPFDQLLPRDSSVSELAQQKIPAEFVPRKWNWEPALIDLIVLANHDDLDDVLKLDQPSGQSELEKWLSQWFITHFDKSPSVSEIRKRASAIMRAFRARAVRGSEH